MSDKFLFLLIKTNYYAREYINKKISDTLDKKYITLDIRLDHFCLAKRLEQNSHLEICKIFTSDKFPFLFLKQNYCAREYINEKYWTH